MRALILSDIHGSADAVRKALSYVGKLDCQKIFLLGDTLYHGPRNPLPEGHGPMGVVEALRPFAEKIIAVRGNCDADVDLMMLDPVHIHEEYAYIEDSATEGRRAIRLFLSHGHIFLPECFPQNAMDQLEPGAGKSPVDAYLYGHTHIWDLHKNYRNVLNVNPGSTSLPKGGNPPTFAIYESFDQKDHRGNIGKFSVHRLDNGKELASIDINDRE
ncbi:MAG: phosphodiesterase [Fibrobacter sp.]|nr:phosphodiesterase [Fibrobacter sp.]